MTNKQSLSENTKKIPISKENPIFFKTLVLIGIITAITTVLIKGRGGVGDFLIAVPVGFVTLIFITWIIGIIPVSIFRKKMNNARINIYGTIFILVSLMVIIGTIVRGS